MIDLRRGSEPINRASGPIPRNEAPHDPEHRADLLIDELRDIYHAEKQLVKALPKMAKAAKSDQLRQAFEHHLEETNGQVERLQQVFEKLGARARGQRCEAMEGLIEEAREMMEEIKSPRSSTSR